MSLTRKLSIGAAGAVILVGAGAAVAAASGHGHAKTTTTTTRPSGGGFGFGSVHAARGFGGGQGFGFRAGGIGAGLADDFAAAASYLGISTDQLKTDLQSGKTLGQIADATSGKSASGLIDALVTNAKTQIASAVSGGKLTQTQADAIEQNLQQLVTNVVNGTHPSFPGGPGKRPGFGFGFHGGFGFGADLSTAATYLGISTSDLTTQLKSGKTLGQIADATSGKSSSGLVDALVTAEKTKIAAAVTAGKLTQAQADKLTASLQQRVTDLVNGKVAMHPGGPRGFGFGGAPPTSSGGGTNA